MDLWRQLFIAIYILQQTTMRDDNADEYSELNIVQN